MQITDTHTHIFLEEFDADREEVILRARQVGVTKFCLPNIDVDSIERLHTLADSHPDSCFPMMGLHPTSVNASYKDQLEQIHSWFARRKYIAVGEIGLDLYWDKTFINEQIEAFEEQLRWSLELDLPVVIHNRDAFPEVIRSVRRVGVDRLRGIFHSFGGRREELQEIISCPNFLIGINGVVTFKNSGFRDYLQDAPLDRIVLETDAPYLTPVPYRGKRNEPSYIPYTATKLAEVYGVSLETIARQTTINADKLFGFSSDCE